MDYYFVESTGLVSILLSSKNVPTQEEHPEEPQDAQCPPVNYTINWLVGFIAKNPELRNEVPAALLFTLYVMF